jgi:flagellar hook-length control protein FliK
MGRLPLTLPAPAALVSGFAATPAMGTDFGMFLAAALATPAPEGFGTGQESRDPDAPEAGSLPLEHPEPPADPVLDGLPADPHLTGPLAQYRAPSISDAPRMTGEEEPAPSVVAVPAAPVEHPAPSVVAVPVATVEHPAPSVVAVPAAPVEHPAPSVVAVPAAPVEHPAPSVVAVPAASVEHPALVDVHATSIAPESPVAARPQGQGSPEPQAPVPQLIDVPDSTPVDLPPAPAMEQPNPEASDVLTPLDKVSSTPSPMAPGTPRGHAPTRPEAPSTQPITGTPVTPNSPGPIIAAPATPAPAQPLMNGVPASRSGLSTSPTITTSALPAPNAAVTEGSTMNTTAPTEAPIRVETALAPSRPEVPRIEQHRLDPPPTPEQVRQVHRQLAAPAIHLATNTEGVKTMTIRLHPEELGQITVIARLQGTHTHLELVPGADTSRELVRAILPDLRRDLANHHAGATLDLDDEAGQPQQERPRHPVQNPATQGSDLPPEVSTPATHQPRGTGRLDISA